MLISCCTGLILENVVHKFPGFTIIAPVLTGICGNIGTISISRISTCLHSNRSRIHPIPSAYPSTQENHPPVDRSIRFEKLNQSEDGVGDQDLSDPTQGEGDHAQEIVDVEAVEPVMKVGVILMILSNVILGGFAIWNSFLIKDGFEPDLKFLIGFLICVTWCSSISLIMANYLTKACWRNGLDPDSYSIPILSSLIDLIGQLSLVVTFLIFKSS